MVVILKISNLLLNCLAFQSFDFVVRNESYNVYQKYVVHTKLDIYVFIIRVMIMYHRWLSPLRK